MLLYLTSVMFEVSWIYIPQIQYSSFNNGMRSQPERVVALSIAIARIIILAGTKHGAHTLSMRNEVSLCTKHFNTIEIQSDVSLCQVLLKVLQTANTQDTGRDTQIKAKQRQQLGAGEMTQQLRGPMFASQHPHSTSQPLIIPVQGDLTPFSDIHAYIVHRPTCRQKQ